MYIVYSGYFNAPHSPFFSSLQSLSFATSFFFYHIYVLFCLLPPLSLVKMICVIINLKLVTEAWWAHMWVYYNGYLSPRILY